VVWGQVWLWLREHANRYAALPTGDQIRARWPEWQPPDGEFSYWLEELKRSSLVRKAAAVLRAGIEDLGDDPTDTIGKTMSALAALRSRTNQHMGTSDEGAGHRFEMYERRARNYERTNGDFIIGIPTGLATLDDTHIGWVPSELVGFYARPTVGKTWMLVNEGAIAWAKGMPFVSVVTKISHEVNLGARIFAARSITSVSPRL